MLHHPRLDGIGQLMGDDDQGLVDEGFTMGADPDPFFKTGKKCGRTSSYCSLRCACSRRRRGLSMCEEA